MADIFVSYTSSDRDWAFWIGHELEDLGHRPHIHEWELSGGADIMAWIETQTDAADHVLRVVSEKYLKAPYSSWERNSAQWDAVTGPPNLVLPVFIETCKPLRLFCFFETLRFARHLPRMRHARASKPSLNPPESRHAGHFLEARSPPAAPAASTPRPPFPGKIAQSNVPIRVPEHFLGRDDSLATIETSLARTQGCTAITAVMGCAASARRRLPPNMPKNIAAITGRPGG
jgi:TIR domain